MRFLLLLSLLAATRDPRLAQGEKLLSAKDCEGLQQLFAPATPPRTERNPEAARLLARGATTCRAQDSVLAFALTQRALALAPDDIEVRTAHAESLIAVDERSEAAKLLEEVLQKPARTTARARLVRAQLADLESESALVVTLAQPLAADPQYGATARELLARHQAALDSHTQARESMAREEQSAAERAAQAQDSLERTSVRSGTEAWSTRGSVSSGGQRTFKTRNLQAGSTYVLHATGTCSGPPKPKRKGGLAPTVDLFGQDFRVRIGTLDPLPLKVGVQPEQNTLTFRAPENNPQIFLEDRTSIRPGAPRCTISDVAVRVP